MASKIQIFLQLAVALGLLNVWLLRARSPTPFRGGEARNLKQEFDAYGLSESFFYLIGTLKIGCGLALVAGIWWGSLVLPAAGLVAVLMLGALAMHIKVGDPLSKSVPAAFMLLLCCGIIAGAI